VAQGKGPETLVAQKKKKKKKNSSSIQPDLSVFSFIDLKCSANLPSEPKYFSLSLSLSLSLS
jgi:hypothetical protein